MEQPACSGWCGGWCGGFCGDGIKLRKGVSQHRGPLTDPSIYRNILHKEYKGIIQLPI